MAGRHALLITVDLLSVFLFSGIVFGWAAFESMLLAEGKFYSSLCAPGTPSPCEEQQLALNRAFTFASTAVSVVALPAGWFVDTYGPLAGTAIAGTLEVIGLLGIAICERVGSAEVDVFLWSLVTVAVGGSLCMFCGYTMPFLFPERATLLISATSCLFDASCIVFPALKVLYDGGVSFEALLCGYVGLAATTFAALAGAWWLCQADLDASRATVDAPGEAGGADEREQKDCERHVALSTQPSSCWPHALRHGQPKGHVCVCHTTFCIVRAVRCSPLSTSQKSSSPASSVLCRYLESSDQSRCSIRPLWPRHLAVVAKSPTLYR